MCGIAGVFQFEGEWLSRSLLQRMMNALTHRGPDESGMYLDDHAGLAHRRLSIIDIAGGIQPIHNEDKTLWMVYNGEVYNYRELRTALSNRGHRFYTQTDTEAVLHLYEEKGADCLQELNGQFALAIWNSEKQEMFLARDPVGIRPLYYTVLPRGFLFGSEIKSIFMDDRIGRELDPEAMDQIFTFWTTLPGYSAFKNVHEVRPGHYLTVRKNQVREQAYWELPLYRETGGNGPSADTIRDRLRDLLQDAVRLRLRSDVPVGTYLSGGLDSSIITMLVKRYFQPDVQTFGIRFDHDEFDEGASQREMVSFLNVDHHEMLAKDADIAQAFPSVIKHCEKPLLRTSPVPLFLLSQKVHDSRFKVVLTGEGADEIFGGYNIFREAKVRAFWARQPDSECRPLLAGKLYPYIFQDTRQKRMLQSFLRQSLEQIQDPFYSHSMRWHHTQRLKAFFSERFRQSAGDYNSITACEEMLPPGFNQLDVLAKAQYLEIQLFMSNYLLAQQGDRVAMAHSVEIRLPFLDRRLIEFMARVPPKWKIRGMSEKYILRKTFLEDLPEAIGRREKHPYRAPVQQSLLHPAASDMTKAALSERAVKRADLFDFRKVALLIRKLEETAHPSEIDAMALAGILSTQLLYDQFVRGNNLKLSNDAPPDLIIDRRSSVQAVS